jgi:putative two-component system response regulator
MMPGMDGYEVLARLKANPATMSIPVIFVTAKSDVGDEAKGLGLGAVDYISKPVQAPIVLARVSSHLTLSRQRQELARSYADLQSLEQQRDSLVHMLVHDMLTPHCAPQIHYPPNS